MHRVDGRGQEGAGGWGPGCNLRRSSHGEMTSILLERGQGMGAGGRGAYKSYLGHTCPSLVHLLPH